jgi:hypothetical protein
MIYDVVIYDKDYNDIRNKYYACYRSQLDWTNILKKYGLNLQQDTISMFNNPTRYYYAVYSF